MGERGLSAVPAPVVALLAFSLAAQIALQTSRPAPAASAAMLVPPYPAATIRAVSGNETIAAAQVSALYLQAFDNQPGVSIPYRDLDYGLVEKWLDGMLALDPRSQYPMIMAAQLYAQVPIAAKQRAMLDFVHRRFLEDPERRWRWLAHAAIVAKHRLKDLSLALRYADDIARLARQAPSWARQMRIFMREDMGEREAATILLGGLLASGEVTDPQEIHFLTQRLEALKAVEISSRASGK